MQIMAIIELSQSSTHTLRIPSYQLMDSSQQMVTIMMPGQAYIFSKAWNGDKFQTEATKYKVHQIQVELQGTI